MNRITVALLAIITLLTLTAPLVLAEDSPQPTGPAGGCSGPDCK